MLSYQVPHRTVEDVFCRRSPTPEECKVRISFDRYSQAAPISTFDVFNEIFKFNPVVDRHPRSKIAAGSVHDIISGRPAGD